MVNIIPPLSITVSGNKCGGCCKQSPTKDAAPARYIVIAKSDGRLVGISPSRVREEQVTSAAIRVYAAVGARFERIYGVHMDDLPLSLHPDISRLPSVSDIRVLESGVLGYAEGLKKARESSPTPHSTTAQPRSEDSQESQ